jgi:hypothetical protein
VTEGRTGGRGGQSVLGHVSQGPLIINSLVFLFLIGGFLSCTYWPGLVWFGLVNSVSARVGVVMDWGDEVRKFVVIVLSLFIHWTRRHGLTKGGYLMCLQRPRAAETVSATAATTAACDSVCYLLC